MLSEPRVAETFAIVESLEGLSDIGELARELAGTVAPVPARTDEPGVDFGRRACAGRDVELHDDHQCGHSVVGDGLSSACISAACRSGPCSKDFRSDLMVTLVGVTLLFSIAECNGTLARLTGRATRLCRGHAGVLPIMFFVIGFVVATIGAGATPASALLAPPAMAVAARAGISPLLMVIMTGNGALAGTLSPFAPTGIVAHGVMQRIGLAASSGRRLPTTPWPIPSSVSVASCCSAAGAFSSGVTRRPRLTIRIPARWILRIG